jgi:hypothetical protein
MIDFDFLNLSEDEGYTSLQHHFANNIFWIMTVCLLVAIPVAIFVDDVQAAILIGIVLSIGFTLYISLIGNSAWNESIRKVLYTKDKKTRAKWAVIILSFFLLGSLIWLWSLVSNNKPLTPALILIFFISLALFSGLIRLFIKRNNSQPTA